MRFSNTWSSNCTSARTSSDSGFTSISTVIPARSSFSSEVTPLIASKGTNLDPVTILVAVLAGGSVMGVYGMILAIPAAACAKIIVTDVLMPRVKAWIKGEAKDPLPIDEH